MLRCFGAMVYKIIYLIKRDTERERERKKHVTIIVHCDKLQNEPLTDTNKIHDHTLVFAKVIM